MKMHILTLGCMLVLLAGIAQAALLPTNDPARFEGNVFIDGQNATDAHVLVYVEGALNKIVTSNDEAYYVATAEGATGDVVTFKVNGVSAGTSSVFDAYSVTFKNLSMTRASSGSSCVSGYDWSNLGCSGELVCCSSNVCRASCSSGGSSGGSGGVINTSTAGLSFPPMVGGVPVVVQSTNGSLDVVAISLTTVNNASNIKITISTLGQPAGIGLPEGTVFEYLLITPQGINDSNVAVAKIKFRVLKSWYVDNNLNLSSTKLNRYHDGVWEILDTVMVSSDDTYYYFEAETPGFSMFAITAKPNAVPITTTCSNTCSSGQSQKAYPDCSCYSSATNASNETTPVTPVPPVSSNYDWIVYLLIVAIVALLVFLKFKKASWIKI